MNLRTVYPDHRPTNYNDWIRQLRLSKCGVQANIAGHIIGEAFKEEESILNQ